LILALESSCDETAVALFDPLRGLTGEWVQSQMALHASHGGVVPALAAREHLRHFAALLGFARKHLAGSALTGVAVTHGPGLAPCLAMGVAAAKAIALAEGIPLVGVNHLRAHAWSPFLALHASEPEDFLERLDTHLPHLGLIVSGGHTLLWMLGADRRISTLSSTRDDAAGEALDKGAKLLGLGYPGGPLIERLATAGRDNAFSFPRGLERSGDLDFSFSGLKTSLRYLLEKMPDDAKGRLPDLCASYQWAVVEALASKTRTALAEGEFRSLGLSGGVANNGRLREAFKAEAQRAGIPFLAADPAHTGDNAGMIAFAAWADEAGLDRSGMGLRIAPSLSLEAAYL
jgi:N6-L-threonylcarbamoyladenine synthase